MWIRVLHRSDNRNAFQSGDAELDRFFAKYAGQNQFRHHLGKTYVAIDRDVIVGYVTVAPSAILIENLPSSKQKRIPYPLPVLRLARLAVAVDQHGNGIGSGLLRFTFELALDLNDSLGCAGILVDAKEVALDFYRRFGFEELEVKAGASPAQSQPIPMFLSLAEIRASVTPR